MDTEDIETKQQWDALRAKDEAERLRSGVVRFIEHTVQTLAKPLHEAGPDTVVHPLGPAIPALDSIIAACVTSYGWDMLNQAQLFDTHFVEGD